MGKFAALKEGDWMDFSHNKNPKCPHCGETFDIERNEAWHIYSEDGPHDVSCPSCDQVFSVYAYASWTFSTDEQEDDDE